MQPNARHAMQVGTPTQFLFPAGQLWIDRTEGHEQSAAMTPALIRKSVVHRRDVLLQQTIETAGPCPRDTIAVEFCGEGRAVVKAQATQRPTREVDVDVD